MRSSPHIDFETGTVINQPMVLSNRTPEPWSIDDKINIFECRVEVWQLGVAVAMLKNNESNANSSIWRHSAYGMLSVIFSYFEMIGKTLNLNSRPRGTASRDFNHGFCDVYPSYKPTDDDYRDDNLTFVVALRDRVRNGMYHLAWTKHNFAIHNDPRIADELFVTQAGPQSVYYLNPHKMVRTIVDHFPSFVARLREESNADSRSKFETFFDDYHA